MALGLQFGLRAARPIAPVSALDPVPGNGAPMLLVVAGQSNARKSSNSGTAPTKYTDGSLGAVSLLSHDNAGWHPYLPGSYADPQVGSVGGAWGTEAELIHRMRQAGDMRPVYIVKLARSGSNLYSQWQPDTAGSLFNQLQAAVDAARSLLAAANVAIDREVSLWNQGETDAGEEAHATNYAANLASMLSAWRAWISNGLFIAERIRPLGHASGGGIITDGEGYKRAWRVREATLATVLADGNARAIDLDFLPANFNNLHPVEPWTEGAGARAHAALVGTYAATYGAITNTAPAVFSFPDVTDAGVSSTVLSNAIPLTGIERRSPVSISGGEWRSLNSLNGDSIVEDWTTSAGHLDKFQKLQLRVISASEHATAKEVTVTVGGVVDTWRVTTEAAGGSSFEPETEAFAARTQALGGASIAGTQKAALNEFYIAAKGSTWWPKVVRLYSRFADATGSSIDLKDQTTQSVPVGSGTPFGWTQALGWRPVGSNAARDIKVNPIADLPQNDAAILLWYSQLASSSVIELSTSADGTRARFNTAGGSQYRINSGANTALSGLPTTPGLRVVSRSAANAIQIYGSDGTQIATGSVASVAPTDTAMFHGPANGSGTNSDAALLVIGASRGLTAQEVSSLRNALGNLLTAFAA